MDFGLDEKGVFREVVPVGGDMVEVGCGFAAEVGEVDDDVGGGAGFEGGEVADRVFYVDRDVWGSTEGFEHGRGFDFAELGGEFAGIFTVHGDDDVEGAPGGVGVVEEGTGVCEVVDIVHGVEDGLDYGNWFWGGGDCRDGRGRSWSGGYRRCGSRAAAIASVDTAEDGDQ